MDTIEAIRRRASYRGAYTDQPVPREDLERIAEAGLIAPSGGSASGRGSNGS
ncbi:MAG: nitroreductase family protein, partial [Spirochaetota bacterium]